MTDIEIFSKSQFAHAYANTTYITCCSTEIFRWFMHTLSSDSERNAVHDGTSLTADLLLDQLSNLCVCMIYVCLYADGWTVTGPTGPQGSGKGSQGSGKHSCKEFDTY